MSQSGRDAAPLCDNITCRYPIPKRHKFSLLTRNFELDYPTKLAALKVSSSVVSLVSYSGEDELFQCTGTIIESDNTSAVVLTSAYIVRCSSGEYSIAPNIKVVVHLSNTQSFDGLIIAYDFHYHLAAIKIEPNTQLTPAGIAYLNDSLPVDPTLIPTLVERKSSILRPHSNSCNLIYRDLVICAGRYFEKPYPLMAAPGKFRRKKCGSLYLELLSSSCRITRCGMGGPMINSFGDVIGICYFDVTGVPFMPINIALSWWEQYKKHGKLRRPCLGMELLNFHDCNASLWENIVRKYPGSLEGVFVIKVTPGSSAEAAGIRYRDIITHFGGKPVRSTLKLVKESWNMIGEVVEVVLIREDGDVPVHTSMLVDDVTPDRFYRWDRMWKYIA